MAEHCRWTADVDLAAFLTEPQSPEWEEFRRHYLLCKACTAEVARWIQLETTLRSMSKNTPPTHPTVEQLAQFQRSPAQLSAEALLLIQQHLKRCRACAEELSFVKAFDFSLLENDKGAIPVEAEKPIWERSRAYREAAGRIFTVFQESVSRLFNTFRPVVLHPAFAYSIALLLCIPAVRYYTLPAPPELSRSPTSPVPTRSVEDPFKSLPSSPTLGIPTSGEPALAALAVLHEYKTAYEARDIDSLRRIWEMSPEVRQNFARLFHEARAVSLLIDVRDVRISQGGKGVVVEFAQVATLLKGEDSFSARGPLFYTADIRQHEDSGKWIIHDLQELPG